MMNENVGSPMRIELFAGWLANGERGLSSEAIVQRLTGVPVDVDELTRPNGVTDYPHDSGDFRRCVELLKRVPEARRHLPLMADVSPQWAAIVSHWDELERLLEEESARPDGLAPKLYRRLRELIEAAAPTD